MKINRHRSFAPALRPLRRAAIFSILLLALFYFWLFRRESNIIVRWSCQGPYCFVPTPPEANISQACKIPEIDLYHPSFVHMIKPSLLNPDCTKRYPYHLLFNSTLENELVPAIPIGQFEALRIQSCCYRYGSRGNRDLSSNLSMLCYPIPLEGSTKVPKEHEFIAIFCKNAESPDIPYKIPSTTFLRCVDVQAFVPMKPEVEERLANISLDHPEDWNDKQRPSVAIFGIDAVSKANLLRTMPKTHKYLTEVMGAVDIQGYNKVGDHTIPNLAKMLTSKSWEQLTSTCAKTMFYDDCPFIWKDFAERGYVTAFLEDSKETAIFNREYMKGKGFIKPPTDYYFRTFNHMNDYYFGKQQKGTGCQGPRLFYRTLLDYMEKFMFRMREESNPFFYFSWEDSLTHDNLNNAQLADEPTLSSLTWMHENNMLENTIFIFMSDHGQHQGNVLKYRQGQLEDRLPPLYFVFPKWFKQKYRRAFYNIQTNMRRFTHTLDIYYTLKDILNLDQLEDDVLLKREHELRLHFRNEEDVTPPMGISLFLPMPLERHCRHTFIEPEYCICHMTAPVDVHDRGVVDATLYAIKTMNDEIEKFRKCSVLILKEIISAEWDLNLDEELRYKIKFQVKFGGLVAGKGVFPEFEAVVEKDVNSPSLWTVVGDVSGPDIYRNYTWCLPDGVESSYCFCRLM